MDRQFSKEDMQMANEGMKIGPDIIRLKENANQNRNEIPLRTHENDRNNKKNRTIISVAEDVENLEHLSLLVGL